MKKPVSSELEIFNSITMLNWAWIYQAEDSNWKQFDCLVCMILESKYQQWKKDNSVTLLLKIGQIHFDKMTAEGTKANGVYRVLNIRRTENKNRQRPNAENRH